MRFTKIPLIATLMAVALSLLIVLPTLAQVSGDRTDGRLSVGDWIDVRVADNIDDLDNTPGNNLPGDGTTAQIANDADAWATVANGGAFDARDTYFKGNLYVSNKEKAYNSILITATVSGTDNLQATGPSGIADDPSTEDDPATDDVENDESVADCYDNAGGGVAIATIRNNRSNTSVTAFLFPTSEDEGTANIYQGIVAVWDQEEDVEKHNGPCNVEQTDPAEHNADAATDDFDPEDGWTHASAAVLPARDGDTLTITVKGVPGSIRVVVDGDAPEIEDATPVASDPQKSTTVQLGFTISDDGSGIRFDGESGNSVDQDPAPQNGDGDQNFNEPLTCGPAPTDPTAADDCGGRAGTALGGGAGDGTTKDIEVRFTGEVDGAYNPAKRDENGALIADTTGAAGTDNGFIDIDGTVYVAVDDTKPGKAAPNPDDVGILKDMSAVWGTATDDSDKAVGGDWTENTRGVEYALDMTLTGNTFGTYRWQVTARDRVGNSVTTDGDEDEDGKQPFSFKVDDADPEVTLARTGIGYEPGEGEFKSRSWIALHFVNGENRGGDDRIRSSTVEADEFTVEGNTVINAVSPTDKPVCKDDDPDTERVDESAKNIQWYADRNVSLSCDDYDPRAHVYLELAEELGSDDEPTIQLLGGILQDIAGNNNATQSLEDEVEDWIAPGIAITITSNTGTASRAATDNEGSFTVNVSSDEELVTFPRLYFATIHGKAEVTPVTDGVGIGGTASGLTIIDTGGEVNLSENDPNNWSKKVNADSDDIPGGSADRIVATIITATDLNGNSGNSAGWTDGDDDGIPDPTEKLDFKKLDAGGFLLEIDNNLAAADIEVLPALDPNADIKDQTESMNPYIQVTFLEPNEYGIAVTDDQGTTEPDPDDASYDPTDDDEDGVSKSIAIKDSKPASTDSHPGVEITAFTLNGEDRLSEIVAVNAYTYVLAVTGLEVGEYTIAYEAVDDVGNEVDEDDREFDFEVLERQPYEVDLQPGWNLISVPGDPFNPAVGNVIGGLKADTVLGYQSGEWVTSVKDEETGRWQGTLVDIQGGYGYWVRTTVVETIETVIPPTLPTSNLPTVPVISGWNLVGVVDAQQRAVGEEVGEDADQYLTSLGDNWRVAYSFETQLNRWEKLIPNGGTADAPHMMLNGKGYWLWNSRPGTLVP